MLLLIKGFLSICKIFDKVGDNGFARSMIRTYSVNTNAEGEKGRRWDLEEEGKRRGRRWGGGAKRRRGGRVEGKWR